MAKEYTIIVLNLPFNKSSVVNDFLRETGLDKDFRVVLAEVQFLNAEYRSTIPFSASYKRGGPEFNDDTCIMRLGLEPLNEEAEFYWSLKGHDVMRAAVDDYLNDHRFNRGVS